MNFAFVMLQAAAPVAEGTANKPGGILGGSGGMLIMMVAIFLVMWLLMIRPQQKRQKELKNFRNSLEPGQKIITAGGIYGKIKKIEDNKVLIEIDNNVNIYIDKSMIIKDPSGLQKQ